MKTFCKKSLLFIAIVLLMTTIFVTAIAVTDTKTAAFALEHEHTGWIPLAQSDIDYVVSNLDGVIPQGDYVLTEYIDVTSDLKVASGTTVNICLDNQYLTFYDNSTMTVDGTLNVYDCGGGGGIEMYNDTALNNIIVAGGTFNLYSGMIMRSSDSIDGEALVVVNSGSFNGYGGMLVVNRSSQDIENADVTLEVAIGASAYLADYALVDNAIVVLHNTNSEIAALTLDGYYTNIVLQLDSYRQSAYLAEFANMTTFSHISIADDDWGVVAEDSTIKLSHEKHTDQSSPIDYKCDYCFKYIFGSGTLDDPYVVKTCDELKAAMASTDNGTNYIKLDTNITVNGVIGNNTAMVLDLNNRTIAFTNGGYIAPTANATIKNGYITGTTTTVYIYSGSNSLTIDGVDVSVEIGAAMEFQAGNIDIDNSIIVAGGGYALKVSGTASLTADNILLKGSQGICNFSGGTVSIGGEIDGHSTLQLYHNPHQDINNDCICDLVDCLSSVHIETGNDCYCDNCTMKLEHTDGDSDGVCDNCFKLTAAHNICGNTECTHTSHSAVEYFALTQDYTLAVYLSSTIPGGSYALVEDITVAETLYIEPGATVNLCLNGHVFTIGGFDVNGGTLNICNCKESGKLIIDTNMTIDNNEVVTLYSGYISKKLGVEDGTATIVVNNGGRLRVLGGKINGNATEAGVSIAVSAIVNIDGGNIAKIKHLNTANNTGTLSFTNFNISDAPVEIEMTVYAQDLSIASIDSNTDLADITIANTSYRLEKLGDSLLILKHKEHTFDREVVDGIYLKSVANCTQTAVYYKSCVCGEQDDENTFSSGDIAENNHASTDYSYEQNVGDTHTKKHACCGEIVTGAEACSGGTATCTALATCQNCSDTYGTTLSHIGGTATCAEQAECSVCGTKYGELDETNHASIEYEYVANTGDTHTKKYACCDATVDAAEECSGGTATCIEKAICEYCLEAYGDFSEHTYTNACDTSCNVEGCDETRAAGPHSGGMATCIEKAICSNCGTIYGEFSSTNHASTSFNYTNSGDGTHLKKHYCCDAVADEGEACSGGAATCEDLAICQYCGVEYGDLAGHNYTMEQHDETNHWAVCEVCLEEDTKSPHTLVEGACTGCPYIEEKVTVEVVGGTVDGDTTIEVSKDGTVTVTADPPTAGKVFSGWKVNGVIVSQDASYSFLASADITVEAVYADAPIDGGATSDSGTTGTPESGTSGSGTVPQPDDSITAPEEPTGLSGGAIAGIVGGVAAIAVSSVAAIIIVKKKKR